MNRLKLQIQRHWITTFVLLLASCSSRFPSSCSGRLRSSSAMTLGYLQQTVKTLSVSEISPASVEGCAAIHITALTNGVPAAPDPGITILLDASQGVTFYYTGNCTVPIATSSISLSSPDTMIWVKGANPGNYTLSFFDRSSVYSPASSPWQVLVQEIPNNLRTLRLIGVQNPPVYTCTSFGVEILTGGRVEPLRQRTVISLSGNAHSDGFYSDGACGAPTQSIEILPGENSARFWYRSETIHTSQFSLVGSRGSAASFPISVVSQNAINVSILAVETSLNALVRDCVEYHAFLSDGRGNATPATGIVAVTLSGVPKDALYSDAECKETLEGKRVLIQSGNVTNSFFLRTGNDPKAPWVITPTAQGLNGIPLEIRGKYPIPTRVSIEAISRGSPGPNTVGSCVNFDLRLLDNNNNSVTTNTLTTITLSDYPSSGSFYQGHDNCQGNPTNALQIPVGQAGAAFSYRRDFPASVNFFASQPAGAVFSVLGLVLGNLTFSQKNSAPMAFPQTLVMAAGESIPFTLLGADIDSQPLSFEIQPQALHGTLTGTPPNLVYHPAKEFVGREQIQFRVSDGTLFSPPAVVTIDVLEPSNLKFSEVSTGWIAMASGNTYTTACPEGSVGVSCQANYFDNNPPLGIYTGVDPAKWDDVRTKCSFTNNDAGISQGQVTVECMKLADSGVSHLSCNRVSGPSEEFGQDPTSVLAVPETAQVVQKTYFFTDEQLGRYHGGAVKDIETLWEREVAATDEGKKEELEKASTLDVEYCKMASPQCSSSGSGTWPVRGIAAVEFHNGQARSNTAHITFPSACANPVIVTQSRVNTLTCGSTKGPRNCPADPTTPVQRVRSYVRSVNAEGFDVFLSANNGVWAGATSPSFEIVYEANCGTQYSANQFEGVTSVTMQNGQSRSTWGRVFFPSSCEEPSILLQTYEDSVLCAANGNSGAGPCRNDPGNSREDLRAVMGNITPEGFAVAVSANSEAWVGNLPRDFKIAYRVTCQAERSLAALSSGLDCRNFEKVASDLKPGSAVSLSCPVGTTAASCFMTLRDHSSGVGYTTTVAGLFNPTRSTCSVPIAESSITDGILSLNCCSLSRDAGACVRGHPISGTVSTLFHNGQTMSQPSAIQLPENCPNPMVFSHSHLDSVACGSSSKMDKCSNDPMVSNQDVETGIYRISPTEVELFAYTNNGVWVGPKAPDFKISYRVWCQW